MCDNILLQCLATVGTQLLVARLWTFDGRHTHNLDDLHVGRAVGKHLVHDGDDAVECGGVVTEVAAQVTLVNREIDIERTLLFPQDPRRRVRLVLGDMLEHRIVLLEFSRLSRVVGHMRGESLEQHRPVKGDKLRLLRFQRLQRLFRLLAEFIDDVDSHLRQKEHIVVLPFIGAAMAALIGLRFVVSDIES